MSYDEHLISMAGGDGETVDQLAAIEARANVIQRCMNAAPNDCYDMSDIGSALDAAANDVPDLLALVREQQAKLDRILKLADWAGHRGWHIAPATLRNTINEARA